MIWDLLFQGNVTSGLKKGLFTTRCDWQVWLLLVVWLAIMLALWPCVCWLFLDEWWFIGWQTSLPYCYHQNWGNWREHVLCGFGLWLVWKWSRFVSGGLCTFAERLILGSSCLLVCFEQLVFGWWALVTLKYLSQNVGIQDACTLVNKSFPWSIIFQKTA